jgi:predicted Zn-dependent protease
MGITIGRGAGRHARALLLAASLALAGCATVQTTAPGAIGVERKQTMLVSEADVEQGAVAAYAKEVDQARGQGRLNADAALLARVHRIAERLIQQTAVFRPDAPGWQWEVNVQSNPELNAYCMPGGKIMVYSGLVEKLSLSDAELAAVIGHEMAHALREHTRERVSRAYAQNLLIVGVATVVGLGGVADLASQVADVTFGLPHSRQQESEADVIGLELMARAGYDPHASIALWQKMSAAEGSGTPQWLSTHPSNSTRLADLEARIPVVEPLYRAARH